MAWHQPGYQISEDRAINRNYNLRNSTKKVVLPLPKRDFLNNNNLFIYSALFNMLGDQKRITTINNLKTIDTNIKNIQKYLTSKRY